jgi:NADPH:quinone reductase-like Zn-dependent oxidoreductase
MSSERTMRVLQAHGREPSDLVDEEVRVPQPSRGEVLVAVHATAVTADELSWPPDLPFIPCHDVSGSIATLGDGVSGLQVGDEVYSLIGFDRPGAAAEYTLVPANDLAAKPRNIDHKTAAVVPLAALTAWQALYQHYHMQRGEHILIHGGGGGVGSYAVQLAAQHGARVTATAGPNSADYVTAFGANRVIDSRTRFEDACANVDVIVDTVGGDVLARSWDVLRPGGTILCIAEEAPSSDVEAHDAEAVYFIVEPNRVQLTELTRLVDLGHLLPAVSQVLPLSRAREGFAPQPVGHMPGKVVIQIR